MSFGIPVRNGLAIGLLSSTTLSSRRGLSPAMYLNFLQPFLDSRITFSRGSNATLVDATGKITYAPANLFTYSEFPNGVTDAPTRGGLLTATTFSGLTGTTGLAFGYDGTTSTFAYKPGAVAGTTYVFSVYVRMDDGGAPVFGNASGSSINNTFAIGIGGAVSVPTSYIVVNMGGGLYRVSGAAVTGGVPANSGIVKYNSNDNRTFTVSGYQLEPVTYQTTPSTYVATTASAYYAPRFDYNPVTLAAKGLLIEEQRTNLLTYSEQFDNASWIKSNSTVTANATTSPDGTVDADKLVENTANAQHFVLQLPSATASTAYTFTVYLKAAERTRAALIDSGGSSATGVFDLSSGAVVSTSNCTASVSSSGNGWYRCAITFTSAVGQTGVNARVFLVNTGTNTTYTGDGVSGIFVYGAQLEAGAFATSYIPTVASQVTRSADVATMTGTNFSSWYNQSEGTFVASFDQNAVNSEVGYVGEVRTDNNNRIQLFANNGAGQTQLTVRNGGVVQADIAATGTITQGAVTNMAAAYKVNDFAVVRSGGTVEADLSGSVPTVASFLIGFSQVASNLELNGHIRQIAYYNTRLPNATLQALTEIPGAYSVDYLAVAGGGSGGGGAQGGGGGAGGYLASTATIFAGTVYTIAVGGGGANGTGVGNNGTNSSITGVAAAVGGGAGGAIGLAGAAGGSGGGAGSNYAGPIRAGGAGTAGQGNAGGTTTDNVNYYQSGGGGGAGAVGGNGIVTSAGAGGNGLASSITGSSVTRAGGGGGGNIYGAGGAGGTGGGGAGGTTGVAGTANTGGGGGGASNGGNIFGAGGSGIVILSIPTSKYTGTTTGSPTVTTSGANTILTFTSSGSYTA